MPLTRFQAEALPRLEGVRLACSIHLEPKVVPALEAMIGRGAAVAEVGKHRHELHGSIAFAAWLGVHAALMSGMRNRIEAFIDWGWDYFSSTAGPQLLDQGSSGARIDWDESDDGEIAAALAPTTTA